MEGLGLQYLPFALSDFRKRSAFSILEAKPADDEVTGAHRNCHAEGRVI
jgi:hypothetical protein